MAKGWINNNIARRSCCVHQVSTGVEHNSCEVRPEEEEEERTAVTTHGHHTQHMDTTHVHTNILTPLIIEYVRTLKSNTCKCLFSIFLSTVP